MGIAGSTSTIGGMQARTMRRRCADESDLRPVRNLWLSACWRRTRHRGMVVNAKKVRRLMREQELNPKRHRRFIATTDSNHNYPICRNLAPNMTLNGRNELWVVDITYVAITNSFVYLAVILDAWSRRVVVTPSAAQSMRGWLPLHSRPPSMPAIHHGARPSVRPWIAIRLRNLSRRLKRGQKQTCAAHKLMSALCQKWTLNASLSCPLSASSRHFSVSLPSYL